MFYLLLLVLPRNRTSGTKEEHSCSVPARPDSIFIPACNKPGAGMLAFLHPANVRGFSTELL